MKKRTQKLKKKCRDYAYVPILYIHSVETTRRHRQRDIIAVIIHSELHLCLVIEETENEIK